MMKALNAVPSSMNFQLHFVNPLVTRWRERLSSPRLCAEGFVFYSSPLDDPLTLRSKGSALSIKERFDRRRFHKKLHVYQISAEPRKGQVGVLACAMRWPKPIMSCWCHTDVALTHVWKSAFRNPSVDRVPRHTQRASQNRGELDCATVYLYAVSRDSAVATVELDMVEDDDPEICGAALIGAKFWAALDKNGWLSPESVSPSSVGCPESHEIAFPP